MKELAISAKTARDKLGVCENGYREALAKIKEKRPGYRISQRLTIKELVTLIGLDDTETILSNIADGYGMGLFTEKQRQFADKLFFWEDDEYTAAREAVEILQFIRRHDEIMAEFD